MSLQFNNLELNSAQPSELVLLTLLLNDIHHLMGLRFYGTVDPDGNSDPLKSLQEQITAGATSILENLVRLSTPDSFHVSNSSCIQAFMAEFYVNDDTRGQRSAVAPLRRYMRSLIAVQFESFADDAQFTTDIRAAARDIVNICLEEWSTSPINFTNGEEALARALRDRRFPVGPLNFPFIRNYHWTRSDGSEGR